MQVKKFEAPTMQEALKLVKTELGPEAIILSTKNHRKGFGLLSKASVEVTAAIAERTLLKKRITEKVMKTEVNDQIQKFSSKKQAEVYDRVGEYYIDRAKARIQARKEREEREEEKEQRKRDRSRELQEWRGRDEQVEVDGMIAAAAPSPSHSPNQSNERRYVDITDEESSSGRTKKQATPAAPAAAPTNYARNGRVMTEMPASYDTAAPSSYEEQEPSNVSSSGNDELLDEIAQLKSIVEELKSEQMMISDTKISENSADEVYVEFQNLLRNGIEKRYASTLTKHVTFSLPRDAQKDHDKVLDALAVEVMNGMRFTQPLDMQPGDKKIIALVGATGVGKTTTIAKLASQAILNKGLKVGLINIDSYKIAATDQLATYAKILGVPFRQASSPTELERALVEFKPLDLVLIDTSGRSQRDTDSLQETKNILKNSGAESLLILSAPTRDQELYDIINRFRIFDPKGLIFSKLDETTTFGCIYNVAQRTGLPLTYFTVGQRVPEDIEAASRERIASLILDL